MNNTIGKRIRKLRDRCGFKQQELADKIGVSRQILSNWERGYTPVDTDGVIKLANILEVSVDYVLYGGTSDKTIRATKKIEMMIEDDAELLIIVNTLMKRDDLRLLLTQAKGLSKTSVERIIKYIRLVEINEI